MDAVLIASIPLPCHRCAFLATLDADSRSLKAASRAMHKGESVISLAITLLVVLIVLAIQKQWSPATLENMASSAEDYVLQTTGLRGRIPDLPGYERVSTFSLGAYRAALYRAVPSPLVFASYRFIIFDRSMKPVFKKDSTEASVRPWTTLYDFAGTHGRPDPRTGGYPIYSRDLTGNGVPDALLGEYSGGDHCCTTVTVIELASGGRLRAIGQIAGLDGLPFEGLEIRKLAPGPGREFIAHRPYRTLCGPHPDAADVLAIYAYIDGNFSDQTSRFAAYLNEVLQQNLAKWNRPNERSLHLLQTVTVDYSEAGKVGKGEEFFQDNLPLFVPQLQSNGIDPSACMQDMAKLVNSIPRRTG
jgi:hypothetical protein